MLQLSAESGFTPPSLSPPLSDFLLPDYLSQVQEGALGQYELADQNFDSGSSVQMPVISQVSSTQNCESTFLLGPLTDREEEDEEEEEAGAGGALVSVSDERKAVSRSGSPDTLEEDNSQNKERSSITIE